MSQSTAATRGLLPSPPDPKPSWRAALRLLRLAAEADGWRLLGAALCMPLAFAVGIAMTYGMKLVTNAVADHSVDQFERAIVLTGVLLALTGTSQFWANRFSANLGEKTAMLLDSRLMALTAGIPGLAHHELPKYLDELSLLRQQRGQLAEMVTNLLTNLALISNLVIVTVMLAQVNPAMLLLPLFAVPSMVGSVQSQRTLNNASDRSAESSRLAAHLFTIGTSPAAGKELRVFGLREEVQRRYTAAWDAVCGALRHASVRATLTSTGGWLVFGAGYVLAMLLTLREAVAGRTTPGDVLLVLSLASMLNGHLSAVVRIISDAVNTTKLASRYQWLVDYARAASIEPADPATVPEALLEGINFDHVSFRYPGSETLVLNDVSFRLRQGSVVAVVGENGAGKTSLVKLLARFYEPDEGRILIDGVELRRLPAAAWRQRIAAGFQDFVKFELLAREAVGVGDLPAIDDAERVTRALSRAGGETIPGSLPNGLDTQLGKSWDEGVDLSGGQWQKLALARALMRERPLLLVFDEPTAALDAHTEYELFERFSAAARNGVNRGSITVLVSHRFSTVRMADLILVLDRGRIVESGSHDELVAKDGLYAGLFRLQARAYS